MATGLIRSFFTQPPTPACHPTVFQRSRPRQDDEQSLEGTPRRGEEEEEDDEEEEEDEESEVQEEEEEECLEGRFLDHPHCALDVTRQLLRFADLISHDVRRYFGRSSDERESCDIYGDSVAVATSGRLRYYDDLLKIARSASPERQESRASPPAADREVVDAQGGLGPLAELFDHRGPCRGQGQPMIKRHLPLSFWSEPTPCSSQAGIGGAAGVTHTHADTRLDSDTHCDLLKHHNTHAIDGAQPDFSDLLANWDPNPEITHTLTESTHMQH